MWTECGQKVSRVFSTSLKSFRYNIGAIAQLGERLRGTQNYKIDWKVKLEA